MKHVFYFYVNLFHDEKYEISFFFLFCPKKKIRTTGGLVEKSTYQQGLHTLYKTISNYKRDDEMRGCKTNKTKKKLNNIFCVCMRVCTNVSSNVYTNGKI